MSLTKDQMQDLYYLLDDIDVKQSYKVLLRLKEVPPEGTDVVKEAVNAFYALEPDTLDTYHFIEAIKKSFVDPEDWRTLVDD